MKLLAKQTQKSWETVTCLLKTPSKRAQEKNAVLHRNSICLFCRVDVNQSHLIILDEVRLRGLLEFNFHHHHGKFLIHIYEVQQSCNYNEIPQRVNVQILTYWEKWARDTLHGKTQISAYSVCYSVNHLFGEALHKRKHWCRAAFGKI